MAVVDGKIIEDFGALPIGTHFFTRRWGIIGPYDQEWVKVSAFYAQPVEKKHKFDLEHPVEIRHRGS